MKRADARLRGPLPDRVKCAEGKPHGTRTKYLGGCRCVPCRAANSRYSCMRDAECKAGNWNGTVSATRARRHLEMLSTAGIGRRTVHRLTGVADSVLHDIRSGRKRRIRAMTQKKIMAVSRQTYTGAQLVSADKTWSLIARLRKAGFTEAWIAGKLGMKMPRIQLNRQFVTARTERKVQELFNSLIRTALDRKTRTELLRERKVAA